MENHRVRQFQSVLQKRRQDLIGRLIQANENSGPSQHDYGRDEGDRANGSQTQQLSNATALIPTEHSGASHARRYRESPAASGGRHIRDVRWVPKRDWLKALGSRALGYALHSLPAKS
jgi:hypothetical protein